MPLINIKTSAIKSIDSDRFLKAVSEEISLLTGKAEKYVMTSFQPNLSMTFGGINDPCCYVEIKSIGSLNPREMSNSLGNLINLYTGIPTDRIYINFDDIEAKNWGYNNTTFG